MSGRPGSPLRPPIPDVQPLGPAEVALHRPGARLSRLAVQLVPPHAVVGRGVCARPAAGDRRVVPERLYRSVSGRTISEATHHFRPGIVGHQSRCERLLSQLESNATLTTHLTGAEKMGEFEIFLLTSAPAEMPYVAGYL